MNGVDVKRWPRESANVTSFRVGGVNAGDEIFACLLEM